MKVKAKKSREKLGLPTVFLLCSLFFFAGLFISTLLSHASVPLFLSGCRPVSRTLESEDDEDHGPILQGDTGDSFIPSIPFQFASFLLYLSNVEEGGGETMFPFENGAEMGMSYDYKKCIGLKIMPKQGDGLLFYSVFPNGTIDPVDDRVLLELPDALKTMSLAEGFL